MNVLHLNAEKGWRGGEQQLAYLVEELSSASVKNFIICRQASALADYCKVRQIPYATLPFSNGISILAALRIKRFCRQHAIDLIHIHGSKPHSLAIMSAVLGNRSLMVLSRRVAFPVRRNFFTQWKYNHHAIKKIICISQTVAQIVAGSIQRKERCAVVYSGIDIKRFSKSTGYLRAHYHISPEEKIIGNVAALSDSKDLVTFLKVAEIFQQKGIPSRFIIVGEGIERHSLETIIAQRNLGEGVILTGFLNNVAEVLPEFDIFLTTAKIEGLGTSVLDAFACRVPVVATRAGGIPEMVIHQETGLLAEVENAAMLTKHLETIIQEPALKGQMVENAYQHLLNHFTKEKMASSTLDIYKNITNEFEEDMLQANKEEAEDAEYQKELSDWEATLKDGLK